MTPSALKLGLTIHHAIMFNPRYHHLGPTDIPSQLGKYSRWSLESRYLLRRIQRQHGLSFMIQGYRGGGNLLVRGHPQRLLLSSHLSTMRFSSLFQDKSNMEGETFFFYEANPNVFFLVVFYQRCASLSRFRTLWRGKPSSFTRPSPTSSRRSHVVDIVD